MIYCDDWRYWCAHTQFKEFFFFLHWWDERKCSNGIYDCWWAELWKMFWFYYCPELFCFNSFRWDEIGVRFNLIWCIMAMRNNFENLCNWRCDRVTTDLWRGTSLRMQNSHLRVVRIAFNESQLSPSKPHISQKTKK